ncbi:phosphatase 2C-like domain-containing protein [Pelagophyceae sp. CCMP2097]|nr:phosphatase 2C-like domain-containing protein [Pelagophyceae sp. CCMP2097]
MSATIHHPLTPRRAETLKSSAPAAAALAAAEGPDSSMNRTKRRTMSEWPVDEDDEELEPGTVPADRHSVCHKAAEIHEPEWSMSPFPVSIVATCHGVEPSHFVQGARAKINQDRGCIVQPYGGETRCALFAVFDGHGKDGDKVSEFCMNYLQLHLCKHETFEADVAKALLEVIEATNAALEVSTVPDVQSGTTCVVALLRESKLWLATAGDSRAVVATRLADGAISARDLTVDQNPDLPGERARIEAAGGFVKPSPEPGYSARVYLDPGFTSVGLAMSRSLGDRCVKHVGVIATPVISSHDLAADDEFLVLASDGIWEFISSQEAVELVDARLAADHHNAREACKELIIEAAGRWKCEEDDYRDDITAIVVRLNPLDMCDAKSAFMPLDDVALALPAARTEVGKIQSFVVDTGHVLGCALLDTTGDGQIDTVAVDTTGDAKADKFYAATPVDSNKDGVFDTVQIDTSKWRRVNSKNLLVDEVPTDADEPPTPQLIALMMLTSG